MRDGESRYTCPEPGCDLQFQRWEEVRDHQSWDHGVDPADAPTDAPRVTRGYLADVPAEGLSAIKATAAATASLTLIATSALGAVVHLVPGLSLLWYFALTLLATVVVGLWVTWRRPPGAD